MPARAEALTATPQDVTSGFSIRGQPAALAAAVAMIRNGIPHAVLVTGPTGVGKSVLAEDLAAALLCGAADRLALPCRRCRACRALQHGNHPDLHRLGPTGPGAVIPIGGRDERGVRDLVRELALMPVEGGRRVAIIASADRMTEDAQSAFLKTLEEPPAGAVLILTAADEERLLPTIRSRCVRLRLGPVPRAEIEGLLRDSNLAEPAAAARLARLAAGRPGVAVALAREPDSVAARNQVGRTLLDLAGMPRADRLRILRDLLATATATSARASSGGSAPAATDDEPARADAPAAAAAPRIPAAERRAAALALVAIWRDLARDIALISLGQPGEVRHVDLLDDMAAAADGLALASVVKHLRRLEVAGERLEGNVSPELVLDALALAWSTGEAPGE